MVDPDVKKKVDAMLDDAVDESFQQEQGLVLSPFAQRHPHLDSLTNAIIRFAHWADDKDETTESTLGNGLQAIKSLTQAYDTILNQTPLGKTPLGLHLPAVEAIFAEVSARYQLDGFWGFIRGKRYGELLNALGEVNSVREEGGILTAARALYTAYSRGHPESFGEQSETELVGLVAKQAGWLAEDELLGDMLDVVQEARQGSTDPETGEPRRITPETLRQRLNDVAALSHTAVALPEDREKGTFAYHWNAGEGIRLHVAGALDQGDTKRDKNNQDYCGAVGGVLVLADGASTDVRGHLSSSEVVSHDVVRYMLHHGPTMTRSGPEHPLERLVMGARDAIIASADDDLRYRGVATTLDTVRIRGRQGEFAHVGDSRIYRIRDRDIEQLTDDHTYAMNLVRKGIIDNVGEAREEFRHTLTRAIPGVGDTISTPQLGTFDVQPGDVYLLCSDGLTEVVGDGKILEIIQSYRSHPDEIAGELVALANKAGGPDNISVIVASVGRDIDASYVDKPIKLLEAFQDDKAVLPIMETYAESMQLFAEGKHNDSFDLLQKTIKMTKAYVKGDGTNIVFVRNEFAPHIVEQYLSGLGNFVVERSKKGITARDVSVLRERLDVFHDDAGFDLIPRVQDKIGTFVEALSAIAQDQDVTVQPRFYQPLFFEWHDGPNFASLRASVGDFVREAPEVRVVVPTALELAERLYGEAMEALALDEEVALLKRAVGNYSGHVAARYELAQITQGREKIEHLNAAITAIDTRIAETATYRQLRGNLAVDDVRVDVIHLLQEAYQEVAGELVTALAEDHQYAVMSRLALLGHIHQRTFNGDGAALRATLLETFTAVTKSERYMHNQLTRSVAYATAIQVMDATRGIDTVPDDFKGIDAIIDTLNPFGEDTTDDDTDEITREDVQDVISRGASGNLREAVFSPGNGLRFVSSGYTHNAGRDDNEDGIGRDGMLYTLCDGAGGHEAGEIASDLAVRYVTEHGGETTVDGTYTDTLATILEDAGNHLKAHRGDPSAPTYDMLTTGVALRFTEDRSMETAWAGDSRLYRIVGDDIQQLTKDHTQAQQIIDDREITNPQEIKSLRTGRLGSRITKAIDADVKYTVDADTITIDEVRVGEVYVMTTDGIHDYVDSDVIADVVTEAIARGIDPAQALVEAATKTGTEDNASAIVVRVKRDLESALDTPAAFTPQLLYDRAVALMADQSVEAHSSANVDPAMAYLDAYLCLNPDDVKAHVLRVRSLNLSGPQYANPDYNLSVEFLLERVAAGHPLEGDDMTAERLFYHYVLRLETNEAGALLTSHATDNIALDHDLVYTIAERCAREGNAAFENDDTGTMNTLHGHAIELVGTLGDMDPRKQNLLDIMLQSYEGRGVEEPAEVVVQEEFDIDSLYERAKAQVTEDTEEALQLANIVLALEPTHQGAHGIRVRAASSSSEQARTSLKYLVDIIEQAGDITTEVSTIVGKSASDLFALYVDGLAPSEAVLALQSTVVDLDHNQVHQVANACITAAEYENSRNNIGNTRSLLESAYVCAELLPDSDRKTRLLEDIANAYRTDESTEDEPTMEPTREEVDTNANTETVEPVSYGTSPAPESSEPVEPVRPAYTPTRNPLVSIFMTIGESDTGYRASIESVLAQDADKELVVVAHSSHKDALEDYESSIQIMYEDNVDLHFEKAKEKCDGTFVGYLRSGDELQYQTRFWPIRKQNHDTLSRMVQVATLDDGVICAQFDYLSGQQGPRKDGVRKERARISATRELGPFTLVRNSLITSLSVSGHTEYLRSVVKECIDKGQHFRRVGSPLYQSRGL